MKKIKSITRTITGICLAFGMIFTLSCEETAGIGPEADPIDESDSTGIAQCQYADLIGFPIEDLSKEESEGLIFMREEEKLARDSYILFYESFGLRNFLNIQKSEQVHMNAILNLINKYGLEDPAEGMDIGEFKNQELAGLFEELQESGQKNKIAALKAGALIEETDILDIQRELDEHVDNEDIRFVYGNLIRGSKNHLRAFVRVLKMNDVEYQPVLLSEEDFQSIINN